MEYLLQDVRYGIKMLRKSPGFTAVAVLSLALGIGANTAIFSLLNVVLLKSLPVRSPQQLVLFSDDIGEGQFGPGSSPPTGVWKSFSHSAYEHLRDRNEDFEGVCAFRSGESPLSVLMDGAQSGDVAQRAQGQLVSGTYFAVLGVEAFLGRMLNPDDDRVGALPATVMSYGCWRERYNSERSVIGTSVLVNGTAFTIVGVAPPEFFGVRVRRSPDFWLPLAFHAQVELRNSFLTDGTVYWLNVMARLKPGITIVQAQTSVNVGLHQFLIGQEGTHLTEDRRQAIQNSYIRLTAGGRGISGLRVFYSQPLHMLMAMVGLVLLIVCANVGNLLVSRYSSRKSEITIRMALGASRGRLVRQLLTESLMLAVLGGGLGMLLARFGASSLAATVARTAPLDLSLDLTVLGFTATACLLSVILFGLAPALRGSQLNLSSDLKEKVTSLGGDRARFGLTSGLVVSQVALSLVLLVSAALFAQSMRNLETENLGFAQDNLLLVDLDPRLAGYKAEELPALYSQILDRIAALPGIRSATIASYSPMSGHSPSSNISVFGYSPEPGADMIVNHMLVAPNYCETLRLALVAGREFGPQDNMRSPKVAFVNEAFARSFFHEANPIGRRFGIGGNPQQSGEIEIIGVVSDAKYKSVTTEPARMFYRPILQVQDHEVFRSNLEIRTESDAQLAAPHVRSALAQVSPKLPIATVTSFSTQFEASLRQQRVVARFAGLFGLLSLLLVAVGIYGVIGQAVVRRTSEIGIRLALGAKRGAILWLVLRDALVMVVIGLAIGVPTALASTRLIESQLFGLSRSNPLTIVGVALLLTVVAVVASYLPARRATRVDPWTALRCE